MNPKRRFFQIHLSTAVVLMLVAGVLLFENFGGWNGAFRRWGDFGLGRWRYSYIQYGWPYECLSEHVYSVQSNGQNGMVNTEKAWVYSVESNGENRIVVITDKAFSSSAVCRNVFWCVGLIAAVCVACEWRIRRRAARKPNE